MKEKKGMLIALEGNEGSGKTTVIQHLKEQLEAEGKTVAVFREPGGTVAGEDIRSIILDKFYKETINGRTEAYLYAASRSELVEKRVLPGLMQYDYVLLDRYYYSSLVWQGIIRGLGIPLVESLNAPFMKEARPDIAFFLSISEEERIRRMSQRTGKQDRLDCEPLELLRRVDEGYQRIIHMYPEFYSVSALGQAEDVARRCLVRIKQYEGGNNMQVKAIFNVTDPELPMLEDKVASEKIQAALETLAENGLDPVEWGIVPAPAQELPVFES